MATEPKYETNGCAFQWEIENISHCWLKKGRKIQSPVFVADGVQGTKWSLWLFPKSSDDESQTSLYINREKDCCGPDIIDVNYQLALLDKDGLIMKKYAEHNVFEKDDDWGFEFFEEREWIFITEREALLPGDTLTIQCSIWRREEMPVKLKYVYARTAFRVKRNSFVWRIEECSRLKSGLINKFKDSSVEFNLLLSDALGFEKKLIMNIKLIDQRVKYVSFKTFIIDSKGGKEDCGTREYFEDDLKQEILFTLLFTNKLMENKSQYLPNDVLSLEFEYKYSNGSVSYEYSGFGRISTKLNNKVNGIKKQYNIEKDDSVYTAELVKDLKLMYNDAICSNVVLRTKTKSFPSHESILSARSPVFRRMFNNDMKEKKSGCVDIIDCEDDIIHRMLLYIYTDSLEDLQYESSTKLYKAADKYEILSLRNRCASFLKDSLCPKNACDVLSLADLHNDEDLKSAAQYYILKQRKIIFFSDLWKNFMNTHLKLAADLMLRKIYEE